MCYYSVITGWCVYYAFSAASGALVTAEPRALWEQFSQSGVKPLLRHAGALLAAAMVIRLGVQRGLERVNRIMIPTLFVILAMLAGYALTIPGAEHRGWRLSSMSSRPAWPTRGCGWRP